MNNDTGRGGITPRGENDMTTFVFKSERNWTKVYDALDDICASFCSYGYKAITVFDNNTDFVRNYCKEHRISYKEE